MYTQIAHSRRGPDVGISRIRGGARGWIWAHISIVISADYARRYAGG
jgi:hypothetical protein